MTVILLNHYVTDLCVQLWETILYNMAVFKRYRLPFSSRLKQLKCEQQRLGRYQQILKHFMLLQKWSKAEQILKYFCFASLLQKHEATGYEMKMPHRKLMARFATHIKREHTHTCAHTQIHSTCSWRRLKTSHTSHASLLLCGFKVPSLKSLTENTHAHTPAVHSRQMIPVKSLALPKWPQHELSDGEILLAYHS